MLVRLTRGSPTHPAADILATVGIVWCACQLGTFTLAQLSYTLIPAFDDLALTELELERLAPVSAAIELLAVLQCAGVVHRDSLASFGKGPITGTDPVNRDAHTANEYASSRACNTTRL